jgi:hypothetical protein
MSSMESPVELLHAAYQQLAFDQGELLSASRHPQLGAADGWLDKGDWQALAAQVGADALFFVNHDPVVVFAKSDDSAPAALRKLYERIWCMSRPQLLFLAIQGELLVYDLTKAPPKSDAELSAQDRLIAVARSMAEVQSKLADYHRERIETGIVFGEARFRDSVNRADRALIRDLKTVRQQLGATPVPQGEERPTLHHLHSLIGRTIFIRYLEDREILVHEYFWNVAANHPAWQDLLAQSPASPSLEPALAELQFLRVLQNKDFTYALFRQLADDFNGDTFPIDDREYDCIRQEHLDSLRGFLLGETTGQGQLFFFAYRFDVIPIELISAIYEEFYNERMGDERNQGSHYTAPALVEFVLTQTLTPEVLAMRPRIVDPACGSGIFLVESFRRIVRHVCAEQGGKRVSRPQLRRILREQIAGIDINEEAVHIAAFSLYLAFLHYQEPREINADRRLPHLKMVSLEERERRETQKPGAEFFDVLLCANAFEAIAGKVNPAATRRFGPRTATVVVGNPPWGYPKKEDEDGQKALEETLRWCDPDSGRPIGDKELSQAFIHLSIELLQGDGKAGLLVSSGVLFKHHPNSQRFRKLWLRSVRLEHVVNFSHVRRVFFSGPQREARAISPFISVVFAKRSEGAPLDARFQYWSAKRTAVVENTKSVVLNRGDLHWLSQRDCLADERLWKIYWWGGHRDESLVRKLDLFPQLIKLPETLPGVQLDLGRGFEVTTTGTPSGWLNKYRELPSSDLVRYGPQPLEGLRSVPAIVYRRGLEAVYSGRRLLVARGIKRGGFINSRFETEEYCFKNSIHGVRFHGLEAWQESVITGIFWSSLARYFYFTTSGSWGFWHDEIHLEDIGQMPICFPTSAELRRRILEAVAELRRFDAGFNGVLRNINVPEVSDLEQTLDSAIFDLYQLSDAERDLVREKCSVGMNLFYQYDRVGDLRGIPLPARRCGLWSDLDQASDGLSAYLSTFLQIWNAELAPDAEFAWAVMSPPTRAPLLAVQFTTRYRHGPPAPTESPTWSAILADLHEHSLLPSGGSLIFIDTFFRYIGDREILFIKRNERRFWTRTAAREDAESALTHVMSTEEAAPGGRQ